MTLNSTTSVTRRKRLQLAAHILEACITDVSTWMDIDRLKLNADKTELLWAGTKYGSSRSSLQLGAETVKANIGPCAFARSNHFFGPQPRYSRFYYMFNVLLLAPSDPQITSITRHRLGSGSCTNSHCVSYRLL